MVLEYTELREYWVAWSSRWTCYSRIKNTIKGSDDNVNSLVGLVQGTLTLHCSTLRFWHPTNAQDSIGLGRKGLIHMYHNKSSARSCHTQQKWHVVIYWNNITCHLTFKGLKILTSNHFCWHLTLYNISVPLTPDNRTTKHTTNLQLIPLYGGRHGCWCSRCSRLRSQASDVLLAYGRLRRPGRGLCTEEREAQVQKREAASRKLGRGGCWDWGMKKSEVSSGESHFRDVPFGMGLFRQAGKMHHQKKGVYHGKFLEGDLAIISM